MKSISIYETGVETSKLPEDKLKYLDLEGLKRFHLVIEWKNDFDPSLIIRDLLKTQYMLDYKWLQPISYKYIAQKTITNGNMNNIETANIQIEPLANDYENLISRIPINQHLEIGTEVTLENSISYELDSEGKMQERKYLSSSNLKFEKSNVKNPILRNFHIGSQEVGSIIRAKYEVQIVNKFLGKFRLWSFRRSPTDSSFTIQLWNYYGLSILELIEMIINYVKNQYQPPKLEVLDYNDTKYLINKPDELIKFLEELKIEVQKTKIEKILINDLVKKLIDLEKK